jgi:hypothetical protein
MYFGNLSHWISIILLILCTSVILEPMHSFMCKLFGKDGSFFKVQTLLLWF